MITDESRPLVLVTTRSFGTGDADPEQLLVDAGLRVARGDARHDSDALRPLLREAEAWIAGAAPVGKEHFELAPNLRIVARYGIGVDAVDLGAAHERGVTVTNTPGANADAVADHALTLLLASLRRVVDADRDHRSGSSGRYVGRELTSLTVGLIGLGNVGRAMARRLSALGATVLAHDPVVGSEAAAAVGATWRPLDELVANCHAVSLHCPGGGPPPLDHERLAALPAGAIVINTAREDVVDNSALAELLGSGHLGAAAVDVIDDPDSPLFDAPRTILTPHVAGHTVQAIDRMGLWAADEVVRALIDDHPPRHPVTP